jgi:sigma-B regulation protein RsbU (phosphoserine phosphatase)
VLIGALGVALLARLGLPLGPLGGLARLVVWLYALAGLWLLGRAVLRRLLWRIRSKLIVSYLFIAVVPLVLLALLFTIAGALFTGYITGYLVSAELEQQARALGEVAQAALPGLPEDPAAAERQLLARLQPARERHPALSYRLVRHGKTVASTGLLPAVLPDWWKGPLLAAIVRDGEKDRLRAVASEGEGFLVLDVPFDEALFADVEKRLGLRVMAVGGNVRVGKNKGGIQLDIDDDHGGGGMVTLHEGQGKGHMGFVALPERVDWETGERGHTSAAFTFDIWGLLRSLSPPRLGDGLNMADLLLYVLAVLAGMLLVVYAGALLIGWLLARSITRSVHALSLGTQRLRKGDFTAHIPVRTRDQLGELAESFNLMSRGLQELMLTQGEKERLEEELRIARQIQMSLLPRGSVDHPGLRIAALCLPATEVGGDYYDLLPLSATRLGVLVADVSGKGTSAALYMAELKGLVLSLSRIHESPARLLSEANRILAANLDSRSFVTMTYAVIDTQAGTLRYARAGHNPLLRFEAATGLVHTLLPPGLGLGLDRGPVFDRVLREEEVPLCPGDMFLFFTDGLSEAMNVRSELFGEQRLRDVVGQSEKLSSEELKERILAEVRAFAAGAAQADDMTMVALKVVAEA